MSKLMLPAVAAIVMFCGSASVQAQYRQSYHGGHGNYNHNHGHNPHHGHYHGGFRPAYYPVPVPVAPVYAAPVYTPSNYFGLQLGNFGLNFGSSQYGSPYQSGYGYRNGSNYYPRGY